MRFCLGWRHAQGLSVSGATLHYKEDNTVPDHCIISSTWRCPNRHHNLFNFQAALKHFTGT